MTSIYLLEKDQEEEFLTLLNKYMWNYDPNKQSIFITYLDKNNLYGWAMGEYLPYGEFEWLKNVDEIDIMSINEKSDVRYILEVDL